METMANFGVLMVVGWKWRHYLSTGIFVANVLCRLGKGGGGDWL
mgnify:CR=1 FL=1